MTVSSELNRKQYTGNGVTTSFATSPVVFFDSSDLDVYVVTTATGAATLLTETTDYIVTGGAGSTGTVATTGLYGAPSASQTLVIVRNVPLTQAADFVQNDASDAEVVEDALDKLTMAVQQVDARVDRSFVLADSDVSGASLTVPTPVAGTLVGWNSAGTALENKVPADIDLAVVSPFIETLLDDTTAAAARTTLGAMASASGTATGTFDVSEAFKLSGDISPSQITANQNDYNPAGLSTAAVLRLTSDASRDITGIQGGADGRVLKVLNVGSFPLVLKTADTGSTAANRFSFDADVTLQGGQGIVLWYDSADSRWRSVRSSNGELRSVQVYTSTGANTWTKPAGLKRVRVTVVGGGGAGGYAAATAGAQCSGGGGGGGGGTSIKTIAASSLGSTETATVGAGGSAAAGGTSSFGSHCSATGGGQGTNGSASSTYYSPGAAGGAGASGDVNISGGGGGAACGVANNFDIGGAGGSSTLGGGAAGVTVNNTGSNGGSYGGGGGGGANDSSQSQRNGGVGGNGIIIVEEFF